MACVVDPVQRSNSYGAVSLHSKWNWKLDFGLSMLTLYGCTYCTVQLSQESLAMRCALRHLTYEDLVSDWLTDTMSISHSIG